jgi:hypothetical protein
MHLTGSFLQKKYTTQNAVVTKKKLGNTGAIFEHLPYKCLRELAQLAQVSKVIALKVTYIALDRFKQLKKAIRKEE